ncbi:MAG: WYL domain-containing protein [Oscillospiraceae bacterium]|nr:WYL domain-containing protein [Oscillospiraceae bacterium]
MANAKLKLLKILEILSETDEDHPLTAAQIGDRLLLYGISAERKSICRDINILKDDAGYDIALSEDNKQGYYMVSRDFEDWELKILIDAVWGAKFLTYESAEQLAQKLSKLTSAGSQRMLKAVTPVKLRIKSRNATTKINIDSVLKAIKANRKIAFQYTYTDTALKPQLRKDGLRYIVNPYALIWQDEHYYLIGNYDKYSDLSYYRLDRMKSLSICDELRKQAKEVLGDNADLQIEEYVRASLYRYGGEHLRLKLFVKSYMVDDLIDFFGDEIRFIPIEDGFHVVVDVMESDGLYFWLLQYGEHMTIVEPESVRAELVRRLDSIRKRYGSEGEKHE